MSMTREEAIASYEKLYDYMVGDDDAIELDYGEFMELNHYIRSALRPVSREQVEKVWRGEWKPTESPYMNECEDCSVCGYRTPWGHGFRFCPACGRAMTDEAVQMVMERLEALKDAVD